MMKKLVMLVFLLIALSGVVAAAEMEKGTVAVMPYFNSTEETKGYIGKTVNGGYTGYFAKAGFRVVSQEAVKAAMQNAGYDASDQMLPEKEVMARIAQETGADYVVAMELAGLHSTRHESYFSTKVNTKCKLKYHFYSQKADKLTPFQTTSVNNNKAVLVGMRSYKSSMIAALKDAMNKGNEKIKGLL